MRTTPFSNDQYYHIFSRGVDHRTIFEDTADFQRFYASLYFFNDRNFKDPRNKPIVSSAGDTNTITNFLRYQKPQQPFVSIASFILLPNHFHLLVRQIIDGGISTFLHRVNMGFAHYFNRRYGRTGCLFESEFKAVLVERDSHLLHLPRYIHLNALDMTNLPWRDRKIHNWDAAWTHLNNYPWSSHHVYMGGTQIIPLVDTHFIEQFFPNPDRYAYFLKQWSSPVIKKHVHSVDL